MQWDLASGQKPSSPAGHGLRHDSADYQSLPFRLRGAVAPDATTRKTGSGGDMIGKRCQNVAAVGLQLRTCSAGFWEKPSKAAAVSSGDSSLHHVEGSAGAARQGCRRSCIRGRQTCRVLIATTRAQLQRRGPFCTGVQRFRGHEMTRLSIMLTCGSVAAAGSVYSGKLLTFSWIGFFVFGVVTLS